jgi:hypothetical protein
MTGEPRPPTAPRTETTSIHTSAPDMPDKAGGPPSEWGVALEWFSQPRGDIFQGSVGFFVLCLAAFAVITGGFDWVTDWFPWGFSGGLSLLIYFDARRDRVLAGSQWVQTRKEWVSTYELTRIRSTNVGLQRAMKLEDNHGHKLVLVLRHAQKNTKLWDLVYNGIVHSVASGDCDISKAARRILKV